MAEKAERTYLAEEAQEKTILAAKAKAARAVSDFMFTLLIDKVFSLNVHDSS